MARPLASALLQAARRRAPLAAGRHACSSLARGMIDRDTDGLEISIAAESGVATLTLSAPRRRNPLTRPVLERLRTFLRACRTVDAARPAAAAVRAIVLEAEGPVFSAGHNFADFSASRLRDTAAADGDSGDLSGADADAAVRDAMRATLDACTDVNRLLRATPQVSRSRRGYGFF